MNALQVSTPLDRGLPPTLVDEEVFTLAIEARSGRNARLQQQWNILLQLIQEKDPSLYQHSRRVQHLARHFSQKLSLAAAETQVIEQAALFHDLGKIVIDDAVLQKTSSLTQKEFEQIQQHPVYSAMLLRQIGVPKEIVLLAYHHHERWDGHGYPARLQGKAIPLGARIIAIVDAFEAMTASRPYSVSHSEEWALEELLRCAGTQFDPVLTDLYCSSMQSKLLSRQPALVM